MYCIYVSKKQPPNDRTWELNLNLSYYLTNLGNIVLCLVIVGPRGAHCTASTSTAGRLRDGYVSQIWRVGGGMFDLIPT